MGETNSENIVTYVIKDENSSSKLIKALFGGSLLGIFIYSLFFCFGMYCLVEYNEFIVHLLVFLIFLGLLTIYKEDTGNNLKEIEEYEVSEFMF